jgi:hypothetical protein
MSSRAIKVAINSGAGRNSTYEHVVTAEDLGFDSYEEWEKATEKQKEAAVTKYWNSQGYPEIYWQET